jgi:hypothetical protein
MIDRFEELLNELGAELGMSLHPDRIGVCTLNIGGEFQLRLETDTRLTNLLVATFICEIPPGKYRENILRDALKCNSPFPLHGTLAFSDKNNRLALFAYLPLPHLNGRKLAAFLPAFIDKARQWRNGVETGRTDHLIPSATKSSTPRD